MEILVLAFVDDLPKEMHIPKHKPMNAI